MMIHMGIASDDNTSGWKLYDPEKNKFYTSNQVRFNERVFPMRSAEALANHAESSLTDIFTYQTRGNWIPYDRSAPMHLYSSVKYDSATDELILRRTDKDNTFCRTTQTEYFKDLLDLQYALVCEATRAGQQSESGNPVSHGSESGNPKVIHPGVDFNRPPRSYRDAMSRVDSAEWAEAYSTEQRGFTERGAFSIVKPPPGVKILGTTTVCDYKMDSGVFQKRKVRMCVRGDQQVEGVNFSSEDLYAPTVKASEVRLLSAIAAVSLPSMELPYTRLTLVRHFFMVPWVMM